MVIVGECREDVVMVSCRRRPQQAPRRDEEPCDMRAWAGQYDPKRTHVVTAHISHSPRIMSTLVLKKM